MASTPAAALLHTPGEPLDAAPSAPVRIEAALRVKGAAPSTISLELTPQEVRILRVLLLAAAATGKGTTVRVAGGWVRDKLLGRVNHDIDIALDNSTGKEFADAVNATLTAAGAPVHTVAVIKANPDQSKHLDTATTRIFDDWIDFVNLRTETYDSHSRIPIAKFGTAEQDSERRDFTVNALFYNVTENALEDFTGTGVTDLHAAVLRTPLPPATTFLDDPLRVLRAVRFSSRFSFAMAADLCEAARSAGIHAALATKISRERVGTETEQMLAGARPIASLRVLAAFNLLDIVFSPPAVGTAALLSAPPPGGAAGVTVVGALALPPLGLASADGALAFPTEPLAARVARVCGLSAGDAETVAALAAPLLGHTGGADAAVGAIAATAHVSSDGAVDADACIDAESLAAERARLAATAGVPCAAYAPPTADKGGQASGKAAAASTAAAGGAVRVVLAHFPAGHAYVGCGQPTAVEPLVPLPLLPPPRVVASAPSTAAAAAAAAGSATAPAAGGAAAGAAAAAPAFNPNLPLPLPSSWLAGVGMTVVESLNLLFSLVPGPKALVALGGSSADGDVAMAGAAPSVPPLVRWGTDGDDDGDVAMSASAAASCVLKSDAASGFFAARDDTTAVEALPEHAWRTNVPATSSPAAAAVGGSGTAAAAAPTPALTAEERRLLSYAALLYPLSTCYTVNSKGKAESLVFLVVAAGLKRTHKEADDVMALHAGTIELARQMAQPSAAGYDRLRLGMLIKNKVKGLWPLALYLATALRLVPLLAAGRAAGAVAAPEVGAAAAAECSAVLAASARLARAIHNWKFEAVHATKPLMDGKAVMALLGVKNGKEVGVYIEELVRWQLLHPEATAEQAADHLRAFAAAGAGAASGGGR